MIEFINEYVFGISVPILLMVCGLFYCIRLKAFHFLHPIRVMKSLFVKEKKGGVSSAKALALALAGTLGVGNMVGVASAIVLGGYGAVFWMWVSALIAMILKYAEIVLAMRHRRFDKSGVPHGTAMYYIKDFFKGSRTGTIISALFALLCIFNALSMGSMIQVNAAAKAMEGFFGIPAILVGCVFALIAFWAMSRGTSGILNFTGKLVPFMTGGFVILSVTVICMCPNDALRALGLIFENAFSVKSGVGGIGGFLTAGALRYGTMRGILSNEAGCGTAPMAHAVSDCSIPAKQGVWGIFEVFVDTILLCSLTALVIIIGGGSNLVGDDYMMITVNSYAAVLGELAGGFISISVLLFGLATVLCWGHYGMESVVYLSAKKVYLRAFVLIYSVCVCLGSVLSGEFIWQTADLTIGIMTVINLCMLLCMNREVKKETERYFSSNKR